MLAFACKHAFFSKLIVLGRLNVQLECIHCFSLVMLKQPKPNPRLCRHRLCKYVCWRVMNNRAANSYPWLFLFSTQVVCVISGRRQWITKMLYSFPSLVEIRWPSDGHLTWLYDVEVFFWWATINILLVWYLFVCLRCCTQWTGVNMPIISHCILGFIIIVITWRLPTKFDKFSSPTSIQLLCRLMLILLWLLAMSLMYTMNQVWFHSRVTVMVTVECGAICTLKRVDIL